MVRFVAFAAALGASLFLSPPSPAQAGILVTVDKASQQMTVEVDGVTRWVWPVSTGRRGYETPAGSFKPFRMEADHYSREWDDAPMPYSIFFTGEGHAIHGSYETRNLGRRASHGCVRISPGNAEKLFTLVKREGMGSARVIVREDPNAPVVAKRRLPEQQVSKQQPARKSVPTITAMPPARVETLNGAPQQAFGYVPAPPNNVPVTERMRIQKEWD